jgi:hypothetical protein
MKYTVHAYVQVRVKVCQVEAGSPAAACRRVAQEVDFHKLLDAAYDYNPRGEWFVDGAEVTDGPDEYLVDAPVTAAGGGDRSWRYDGEGHPLLADPPAEDIPPPTDADLAAEIRRQDQVDHCFFDDTRMRSRLPAGRDLHAVLQRVRTAADAVPARQDLRAVAATLAAALDALGRIAAAAQLYDLLGRTENDT